MTSLRSRLCGSVFVAVLLASLVSFGCGGGGGGGTTSGPVTTFAPDSSDPPPSGSLVMLAGGSSGATITIRIAATQINNFFGAAFHVNFDATALRFNGMDSSGSFLQTGVATDVFFQADNSTPGVLVVTASRLDPTAHLPVNVTTTSDLVTLSFSAKTAIPPGSATGLLSFDDPKQVCDGTAAYPLCGAVPGITWLGGRITSQ